MPANRRMFRGRGFVAILVFLSFLAIAISGTALYLRPEGSIARWIGWTFLGLDRKEWENVHIVLVSTFIIIGSIHLVYNLRTFLSCFRIQSREIPDPPLRRLPFATELAAAVALTGAMVLAVCFQIPRVAGLTELRSNIKEEVERILDQARRVSPNNPVRGLAFHAMIGLAASAGLRIGEVVGLASIPMEGSRANKLSWKGQYNRRLGEVSVLVFVLYTTAAIPKRT